MNEDREIRMASLNLNDSVEDKMVLEGYAIVFNQETLIGTEARGFREVIEPAALTNTKMKDVPLKYNHQDNFLVIARTKNKSLELLVDEHGLKVRANLLDTESNKDIYKMVKNGLLDKMSFAFTVSEEDWDTNGDIPLRKIKAIDRLYDVSIVDIPAYEGTSIYSRSLNLVESRLKAMELEKARIETDLIKQRTKLKLKIGGN